MSRNMAAHCLMLMTALILTTIVVEGLIENYDDKKCIIDKKLPAEAPGNYKDCNIPEAIEANTTRCCKLEGGPSCCGTDKMVLIGGLMAGLTIGLMVTCLVVFWCEPKYVPCLKPCLKKCRGQPNESDKERELTDLAHGMRSKNMEYVRGGQQYAPANNTLDIPDEMKMRVDDSWWGITPSQDPIL